MTAGDIFWANFPPRGGREQSGRRPALILQNAATSEKVQTILTVPLTTQLAALRFPGTVFIETDETNGLRRDSVALVFQITAIDSRQIEARLGTVSQDVLIEVYTALNSIIREESSP